MRLTLLPLAFTSLAVVCLGAIISPKAESLDLPLERRSGQSGDYCNYNNDCVFKQCDRSKHKCWVCPILAVF